MLIGKRVWNIHTKRQIRRKIRGGKGKRLGQKKKQGRRQYAALPESPESGRDPWVTSVSASRQTESGPSGALTFRGQRGGREGTGGKSEERSIWRQVQKGFRGKGAIAYIERHGEVKPDESWEVTCGCGPWRSPGSCTEGVLPSIRRGVPKEKAEPRLETFTPAATVH